MKNALKNRAMFFGAPIVGIVVVFIFSVVSFGAQQARAYTIGSASPTSSVVGGYDVGSSLQNLVSPFTEFVSSLKWNNDTTVNSSGMSLSWPTVNLTSVSASTFQNTLSQWFNEFNNWFYSVSGVQLSAITLALLNLFSWVLGLVQQAINWLVGLFH